MRDIASIIVHHSASKWGSVEAIRDWHKERGFLDIGYHYVITNGHLTYGSTYDADTDGKVWDGRPLAEVGAHAEGHNADSIGVCLVGDGKFTRWQYVALIWLLVDLNRGYHIGLDNILGHCEVDPARKPLCPGFDMELLRAALTCAKPTGDGSNPA